MPICENPSKTAPLPTEVDHHAEAAKVKKTREQAYFNSYDFDAIEVLPSEEDDDPQIQSSVKDPENTRQNGAAVANAYLKRLTLYFSNTAKHRKSVKKRSSIGDGVEGIQNGCERSSSSSSSTEDSSSKLYSSKRDLDDKKTANGFLLPRAMLKYQCSLGNSMSATAAGTSTSISSSKIRSGKSVVTPGDSSSCGINSKHIQCSTRANTDNSGFTQCYDKSDRDRVISASHYSTEKSGSSGYYGSNLCSSSSVEDHIYSEPVIDIIEPRVPSLGNLSSHPSIKDDGSKDSGSCKTLTNADKISENLRILETSLENLDRHLKSYSKNGTHQRASSFAGYSLHSCLSSYEKAKSDQLPTIMEGGDCQSNRKTANSWSEDTDSLVDIDLDSFLLENERVKSVKNTSESLKGIDNPTFDQSQILDEDLENNYKCSKYVNSCPENAYKLESVIETEKEDKSLAFFLKKYEDQIHFQSTREMLEEIRDKLRILVQSANGENTDIPKDLENNIATLKVELEAYLRIMSHTSEMEIKQFCTGVVNNQKLVTMTKAFERRKSLTSSDDCEITYEAIRSGSSPGDIDNTSVRCSDPNFKLKRKTLAEIFPNTDEECYNCNSSNNINNSSSNDTLRQKTEEAQTLSSLGINSSHLQRNLSFQRPKLDNTNPKIQQEQDTILEWHKNKPSIWELYYGTNRINQSLVGKRGQMVKNSASLMSYIDRANHRPMGGALILLAGDFRQILPVIQRSTPANELKACLKASHLWQHVKKITLSTNMRTHLYHEVSTQTFATQLLGTGDCKFPIDPATRRRKKGFPNISRNYKNHDWLCQREMLAPKNDHVNRVNDRIQLQLPGQPTKYEAIDTVTDEDQSVSYPTEFLNLLVPSGIPLHIWTLKIGSPIMLVRNLDPPKLCNGTRLAVKEFMPNMIEATIISGKSKGEDWCPKRLQFPVTDKLLFSVTSVIFDDG